MSLRGTLATLSLVGALGLAAPGVADAAEYLGQYQTREDCQGAAANRGLQDPTEARYVCSSNGNPASGDYASYALYKYPA